MAKTSTSLKPGQTANPRGRPKGAGVFRAKLAQNEAGIVDKLIEKALAGDMSALRICVERLLPPAQASAVSVDIPVLASANTLTDKAHAIVTAVGQGLLNTDAATAFLSALGAVARIVETDDLARRVAALEVRP